MTQQIVAKLSFGLNCQDDWIPIEFLKVRQADPNSLHVGSVHRNKLRADDQHLTHAHPSNAFSTCSRNFAFSESQLNRSRPRRKASARALASFFGSLIHLVSLPAEPSASCRSIIKQAAPSSVASQSCAV